METAGPRFYFVATFILVNIKSFLLQLSYEEHRSSGSNLEEASVACSLCSYSILAVRFKTIVTACAAANQAGAVVAV